MSGRRFCCMRSSTSGTRRLHQFLDGARGTSHLSHPMISARLRCRGKEKTMNPRIDARKYITTGAGRAMLHFSHEVESSGLERPLLELVKIRASQMNGCAYCIDMHTKDARAAGETEQRIYALNAWRETPFFSSRERAALDW